MNTLEVTELEEDIIEAFSDLGMVTENPFPIKWLVQITGEFDPVTRQTTHKIFNEGIDIVALATQKARKDEMLKEGLNYDEATKIFVVGKTFRDKEIIPKEWDRIDINGMLYDIAKLKPTPLALVNILWTIFLIEAPIAAQTEEIREERDSGFEIEGDKTSTVFEDLPAYILGTEEGGFTIEENISDMLSIKYNSVQVDIKLTASNWSVVGFIEHLQTLLEEAFEGVFVVSSVDDFIRIETLEIGEDIYFDVLGITHNCYSILGFTIGRYYGDRGLI